MRGELAWYAHTDTEVHLDARAVLAARGSIVNLARLSMTGARVITERPLVNQLSLTGSGVIEADRVENAGDATFLADTEIRCDYTTRGTTSIANGRLSVRGSFASFGVTQGAAIDGGGGVGENGLVVEGDFFAAAESTLLLPASGQILAVGGNFDVAIQESSRLDLSRADLRLIGAKQTMECLGRDIGPDRAGLDRKGPGHFPIGALRIGPGATVSLVDKQDNDGLGASTPEALYVHTLAVGRGATLLNRDCRIYYENLSVEGTVEDPRNLIPITPEDQFFLRGDCNRDGNLDVSDAISTLLRLFLRADGPVCADACDSNDDGAVNIADATATLNLLFLGQGDISPPGSETCGVDPSEDKLDCSAYGACR